MEPRGAVADAAIGARGWRDRRSDLCRRGQHAGTTGAAEVYNPATNRWTTLAAMPTARNEIAAAVLDRRLFIAGGKTGSTPNTLIATLETIRPPETTWWTSRSEEHTSELQSPCNLVCR